MNTNDRRALLTDRPNPEGKLDYIAALKGTIRRADRPEGIDVTVHYVPDRSVLAVDSFGAYLDGLGPIAREPLEQLGTVVMNDLNNHLVPRWIEVRVSTGPQNPAALISHAVLLTDRQPKWDNPGLLARLRRY